MGAGGGMWASARAELLRPGLRGGGGGRPFWPSTGLGSTATGTGATAGTGALASFADFLIATGNGLALAGLAKALTATFATGFATTLALALAGATGFGGAALAFVLDVGLIVAFGAALALADFLGTGLAAALGTGFFTATLGLTTGLAIFLATGLATALGATLDTALAFATALTLLTTALAVVLALLAGFPALADFAGFAFTACLLWEAASGWTPAPTPDLASALVFWSARDCSGCPAWRDALKPNRWRIDTNMAFSRSFSAFLELPDSLTQNQPDLRSNQTLRQALQKNIFGQVNANKNHLAGFLLPSSPGRAQIAAH